MTTISYEVRLSDSVENTGLAGAYFADRADAEKAAAVVNEMFPRAGAEVYESASEPNTTFEKWDEAGW